MHQNVTAEFADVSEVCDDIVLTESEMKSLIFIAGYIGFKVVTMSVDCDLCKSELVSDQTLQVDLPADETSYIHELDRGGLKWPTDLLVEVVTQMFLVFRCVISSKYESKFLTFSSQRAVLIELFNKRLNFLGLQEGKCVCGSTMTALIGKTMRTAANIFFNNYCKRAADKQVTKDKGKRKLSIIRRTNSNVFRFAIFMFLKRHYIFNVCKFAFS